MVETTALNEFRHVARSYRVGLFKREIVLVLQQQVHHHGEHFSPDPAGGSSIAVNRKEWVDCKTIPADQLNKVRAEAIRESLEHIQQWNGHTADAIDDLNEYAEKVERGEA